MNGFAQKKKAGFQWAAVSIVEILSIMWLFSTGCIL
jgi:hypothetical protein